MRQIDFRVRLFLTEHDRERSERAMHWLLHALCCINVETLRAYPGVPPLYGSGVRYDNERAGKPEWQDALDTWTRKRGDCKDLACWRVAEWWMGPPRAPYRGRARPFIRYRQKVVRDPATGRDKTISLYHVLVQRPDGTMEDPSRILGMHGSDGLGDGDARDGRRDGAAMGANPVALATILFP